MARYRKIDVRIWNDSKFSALSDQAQLAFIFVLTHPTMTPLGALRGSPESLAADKYGCEGSAKAFREAFVKAFRELFEKGLLKSDSRGLLFAVNFLKYNIPESPNVIKSWKGSLDVLPECKLLGEVLIAAESSVSSLSEGYRKAFQEAFGEALAKAIANQEQEQEQDISTNVDIKEKYKKEKKQSQSKKVLSKPEDVSSEQTWSDFLALRNARHAPLTETALNIIRKEAEKAGISLEDALKTCCMRGWRGFKAEWINNSNFHRQISTQSGPRDLEPDWSQIDYGESGLM